MIAMPKLEEGRLYHREEVGDHLGFQTGSSNFDIAALHFPRNLDTWDFDFYARQKGAEILLRYRVFSMDALKPQLRSLEATFWEHETERKRVETIIAILQNGGPVLPVLMQQNDPKRRVIEGMHRSVALLQLESYCLPAFLMGYRNWFADDEPLSDFEEEDEIASATLREANAFFRHATCVDQGGIDLVLFDLDQCDEVLAAKFRGQIIGAVTMMVKKSRPMLRTCYVLKQYRRKHVAYRLCEKAMLRFKEAGAAEVLCDVRSNGMDATLKRLKRERPELEAMVRRVNSDDPLDDMDVDLDALREMNIHS